MLHRRGGVNVSFPSEFMGTLTEQVSYAQSLTTHPAARLGVAQAKRPISTHWTHILLSDLGGY